MTAVFLFVNIVPNEMYQPLKQKNLLSQEPIKSQLAH